MNQLNLFWETWIDVVDYEGFYQVNGRGDVKSLNYMKTGKEKILRSGKTKYGYMNVTLSKNGNTKTHQVHRLVYKSFYGNIPDGMVIDHIDGNKLNNSVENLRCVTPKEHCNNPITLERNASKNRNQAKDPEWLRKTTEAARKRAKDPEWMRKNSEGIKKRSQNSVWRKNQSEAMRKLAQDPEWRRKNAETTKKACSKPVNQYTQDGEFVNTWPSVAEVERELGFARSNISTCCLGKYKQAYGFIWKYKEVG